MHEMNPFNFTTTMEYIEETKPVTPYNTSQKLSATLEEKYKKEKSQQLPKLLEEMDSQTREVLMLWLVQKSKDSFAEQENKTNARLDRDNFELDKREEEWHKANETRADILHNMLMSDEEYRKLEEKVKKHQEEIIKNQIRLAHEQRLWNAEQTAKEEFQKQREHETAVLEEELHKKYVKAEEQIKRNRELRKRAALAAEQAREEGLKRKYQGVTIDITAQLNRLKVMHSKLEEGRKTLEREEERRKARGPGGEEDELCTLCKKEDEIFKLESEVVKINNRMKTQVCIKQPGCKETLQFESDRLKQEVDKRRALLMEMIREAESDKKALKDFIFNQCPSQPAVCTKQIEWQKRLQLKKVEDMLHRMNKREAERALIRIYKCLYENRKKESLHPIQIDRMFGVPAGMNENALNAVKKGCSTLLTTTMKNADAKPLHQCICMGDEKQEKIAAKLGSTMNKRIAASNLASATKQYRAKKQAEQKAEQQEEAKEIEKDVIAEIIPFHPEVVKQGGSVDDVAKRAIAMAKITPGIDLKKIRDESHRRVEERHDGQNKKCPDSNCDKLNKAEKVSPDLLNKCLNDVNSEAIRANLRRAFQAGTKATGCALLSLASNPLLQQTHKCVCE